MLVNSEIKNDQLKNYSSSFITRYPCTLTDSQTRLLTRKYQANTKTRQEKQVEIRSAQDLLKRLNIRPNLFMFYYTVITLSNKERAQ